MAAHDLYVLDGTTPVLEPDLEAWSRSMWTDQARRTVAKTQVGTTYLSTIFLGTDHNFREDGTCPVLFETICCGDTEETSWVDRYCTWDEAVEAHQRACHELTEDLIRQRRDRAWLASLGILLAVWIGGNMLWQ